MSINRIRGDGGVIIDSQSFLELPKAPTKQTSDVIRAGMLRYNKEWKAFEGVLDFTDGTVAYRRFANLDENGKLLSSQLPDSVTSGMQFKGTYSPISDDIDPPSTIVSLPSPSSSVNGDYYVIRGIMDAAQTHYETNLPATSPVTFTAVNPTGQGNWIQILYYFDQNPVQPSTKIVTYAFGRIVTASIPASGHAGLISVAQDPDLTTAFNTSLSPQKQTAFTDGDWVINTTDKNIRLRQSRASISASAVLYDGSIIVGSNRDYTVNAGTSQTTLDNLGIEALRRTGDSMYDDGKGGGGRLGIRYGSAVAPSMTFNDAAYDPVTNSGNKPSQWTDSNTGIFHPANKAIGFTTSGVERLRIADATITLNASNAGYTPSITFGGSSNTNVNISATSNIISFNSVNKTQVEMQDGITLFHGNITVDGTSLLTGAVTMSSNLSVLGNTTIGDSSSDTLTVNSTSTFNGSTLFNATSNRFKNINLLSAGLFTFENGANLSTIGLVGSDLQFKMGSYADLTIYDGATIRTKFNRYGIQIPVLITVDNAVGVDGMIAYSPTYKTSMQKVDGQWIPIGTGRTDIYTISTSDWVLSGSNYTYTVSTTNVNTAEVQELVSAGVYAKVEVDSIQISSTSVVFTIPATPDVRFNGRVLVTVRQ